MLHVSNPKAFTNHVKVPAIVVLLTIGFAIGLFGNVYLYGQPITLFVAMAFVACALVIVNSIKEEDK